MPSAIWNKYYFKHPERRQRQAKATHKYMIHLSPTRCVYIVVVSLILIAAFIVGIISIWQKIHGNVLWKIVHESCVPDMERNQNPSPCVSVDLKLGERDGVAVLKDVKGKTQYLVIPTRKITGIESKELLEPYVVNYFSVAWNQTDLINQRLGQNLPRTDFAIAINSIGGRSQNQLHFHVDCIKPSVKSILQQMSPEIQAVWHDFPVKLVGHHYRAIWLPGSELGSRNPFQLLANSLPIPIREMGAHTLVLVGAQRSGEDGFILLDGQAPRFAAALSPLIKVGLGSGEELEDHNCTLVSSSP